MSMTQLLEVVLDGYPPQQILIDQRDIAQVEMQDWYGGERHVPLTTLRHLAYTAMLRQGYIPADTTWRHFTERLCVSVDAADDDEQEDEQGADPTQSSPGPTTTSDTGSSSLLTSPVSRSRGRQGSNPGTPAT